MGREQADAERVAPAGRGAWREYLAERSPVRVAREAGALTFRGSRADLEFAAALRLQAVVVLVFLLVRTVHLSQAGVDLAFAGHAYERIWLALALAGVCVTESAVLAVALLGARRVTLSAMLGDAAFGFAGLAVMRAAVNSGSDWVGSLNWMLPYTVATSTGLGLAAVGDLVARAGARDAPAGRQRRMHAGGLLCAATVAVALGGWYVLCAYVPQQLSSARQGDIRNDAALYIVFFVAGAVTAAVTRRRVAALSARNAEVTAAESGLAREAQWRAIVVDVFGPVITLLDRVAQLENGEVPRAVREEADRLICMIDAVRPGEAPDDLDEVIRGDSREGGGPVR